MAVTNPKEALNNLYGLMMEINFHKADTEILEDLCDNSDPFVDKHLRKIKQLQAKLKAEANKQRYNEALDQLKKLKERGLEEFKRLLNPHDQLQLQPLFRKFEELTHEDEASLLEDYEMLKLMEILKDKVKGNDDN